MNLKLEQLRAHTRRHFFKQSGLGFGAIALQQMLAAEETRPQPKFRMPAKAKSIIYLHMAGSPSQIDLFENKPALTKYHGKDCPQEYLEGKRFAFIKGTPKMMGPEAAQTACFAGNIHVTLKASTLSLGVSHMI